MLPPRSPFDTLLEKQRSQNAVFNEQIVMIQTLRRDLGSPKKKLIDGDKI